MGDELLVIGHTTGVYEDTVAEIRVDNQIVESVAKGVFCSLKTKGQPSVLSPLFRKRMA